LKNASKSLNKLIDSQIVDNCKKGLGYNAVPPPYTGLFMPPKPDLSYIGLKEFTSEPAVEILNAKTSEEVPKVAKKDNGAPIIEDWKSDDEDERVPQPQIEKKTVKPSVAKVEFVKPKQQSQNAKKTIQNVEKSRQSTNSKRDNQRNWNYMMSQRLGSNFKMYNKVCYECGSFDHLQEECNYHQRKFQYQKVRVNTVRNKNVNSVRPKVVVNTARPKAVLNAVKGNEVYVVKASACRVWKPKNKILDHVSKYNSASITLKKFDYIDAQGISKSVMD
nr:retrotransposon Orf1 [Tanacetum cinerariifolium]